MGVPPSGHATTVSVDGPGEFAGSGAIGRYWLTRSRGFEVRSTRGRRLGVVERLELDRETRAVVALLVRRRGRKALLRLRPEAVGVVDPWGQSLVAALPRRRRSSALALQRRRPSLAVPRPSFNPRLARGGVRRLGRAGRLVPRAARGLGRAVPRALLIAALAVWLYALVVFTLVRLGARLLVALTVGTARGSARLKPHLLARL